MSEQVDLIIKPQWILPIVPANTLFEDCALVVNQGRIVAIAPIAEAERKYQASKILELPNQVLMPGLINAHGHAAMSLLRNCSNDLSSDSWLAESSWMSADFVRDGTRQAMAEMIPSGTTCFADTYLFPEVVAEVAIQAGLRSCIAFPIFEFTSVWAQELDDYIHKGLTLRDNYKNHPLTQIAFGLQASQAMEDASLNSVGVLAEELDARIHIRLQETLAEVKDSLKLHAMRPVERMQNLGILSPRTEAVHMTQATDSDIELLARYNTSVIHCPESNMQLANGCCPITKLQEAGVQLALGTDSAATTNNLDMFKQLHSASLLAKVVADDAAALNAFDSLKLATLDGATALGIEDQIGSLELGKQADMIAVSVDALATESADYIASQLVYAANSSQVTHSWVAGRQLLAEDHLTTLNVQEIRAKSREWRSRISCQ